MNKKFIVSAVISGLLASVNVSAETKIGDADIAWSDFVPSGYWYGVRVSNKKPSISKVSSVTVGVKSGSNVANSWKVAVQNAIIYLNYYSDSYGSAVHFQWTGSINADVLLSSDSSLPSDVVARTDIVDYNIGKNLRVNASYNGMGHSYKVGAMQHELLHTIGFRHSGTIVGISSTSQDAVEVPNTDNFWDWYYTGTSITGTYGSVSQIPFYPNYVDKKALAIVYPD